MLNAAPGLYASVKRTTLPMTRRGRCSTSFATARNFVMKSSRSTMTAADQYTRPLMLLMLLEVMRSESLPQLSRFATHRRGRRRGNRDHLRFRVLAPEHPCEE